MTGTESKFPRPGPSIEGSRVEGRGRIGKTHMIDGTRQFCCYVLSHDGG